MNDVMRRSNITRTPMQIVTETMAAHKLTDADVLFLALAFIQNENLLGKFAAKVLEFAKKGK